MNRRSLLSLFAAAPALAIASKVTAGAPPVSKTPVLPRSPQTAIGEIRAFHVPDYGRSRMLTTAELPSHTHTITDPCHSHSWSVARAEYQIFDGERFVHLNSSEGVAVVERLRA